MGDEFDINISDLNPKSTLDIEIKCDCCGRPLMVHYYRYNDAIEKYGNYYCNHCSQQRSLAERQTKLYNSIVEYCDKNNYDLLTKKEDIISRQSNIKYICPQHGEYETKATNILQGKLCYQCSRINAGIKRWEYDLQERQKVQYGKLLRICNERGYKLLSKPEDIMGYESYIRYNCPIHGEKTMKVGNMLSGKGCRECWLDFISHRNINKYNNHYVRQSLDKDVVEKRVFELGGILLNKDDYVNNSLKNLKIICPRCGEEFTTSLSHFEQHGGQVCEDCYKKESVGERKIRVFLERNNIVYNQEYWFPDCRDINPLPFDFYIPETNTLIEFDGKQHFDETHFFNISFEKIQKHDNIKNEYCKINNIHLIRIPYWDLNKIDEILLKEIII